MSSMGLLSTNLSIILKDKMHIYIFELMCKFYKRESNYYNKSSYMIQTFVNVCLRKWIEFSFTIFTEDSVML